MNTFRNSWELCVDKCVCHLWINLIRKSVGFMQRRAASLQIIPSYKCEICVINDLQEIQKKNTKHYLLSDPGPSALIRYQVNIADTNTSTDTFNL